MSKTTALLARIVLPFALSFATLLAQAGPARAAEILTIAYRDKPPYSTEIDGKPQGLLIDKSLAIFKAAGIPVHFVVMPQKRITTELAANTSLICSPGWYRLPEREAVGPFSVAIHRDKPQMVLAAESLAQAVRAHPSLKALMQDPSLKLGAVDGVSYGGELDAAINTMARPPMRVTVTVQQLSRMIAAQRADYMFVDQEDFAHFDDPSGLRLVSFPDNPAGLTRHFWCSSRVKGSMLQRIDAAIHRLGYDK
ncbi:substrate-binding periplasmic protein [Burkholderiaceae bacterium UC74_6]